MKPTEARTPEELVEAWRGYERHIGRRNPLEILLHGFLHWCADDLERVLKLEAEKGIG